MEIIVPLLYYKTTLTLFNSCSTMVLSHPSFYHGYAVHVLMEMTGQESDRVAESERISSMSGGDD